MRSFGPYHNLVELGRGGMATVYRATAPDGHLVALKVLAVHLAEDRTARTRFEQESALGLVHPNIVGVHKAGIEGDTPFIEMDYVPGESLDRLIVKNGPLTAAQLVPILNDAAAALDFAHARNVIHRDVKPSNIIIRGDGRAMLADFGVAKAAGMTAYTATQARVGSVYYMSPEQASGSIDLSPTTDIYSLGVTAFYALTGKHPFEGGNEIAIARMHVDRRPPHISDINPKVPRYVGDVVMRALEKQPTRRPASAGAFAHDFARVLASPPPPVPASQAIIVQTHTPASGTAVPAVPPTRISPAVWAAAAMALALVGLIALGAWLLRPGGDNTNDTSTHAGVTVIASTATFAPLPPDQVLTPVGNAPLATTTNVIIVQTAVPQTYPTWTPVVIVYPTAMSAPVPPAPLPIVTSPVISPIFPPTPVPTVPTVPPPATPLPPPTVVPPTLAPTPPMPTAIPTIAPPVPPAPTNTPGIIATIASP